MLSVCNFKHQYTNSRTWPIIAIRFARLYNLGSLARTLLTKQEFEAKNHQKLTRFCFFFRFPSRAGDYSFKAPVFRPNFFAMLVSQYSMYSPLFIFRHIFVEVGTPVARSPPHRSRRAVFPHRALQVNSHSHGSWGASATVDTATVADKNSVPPAKAFAADSFPQYTVVECGNAPATGITLAKLNSGADSAGSATCIAPGRSRRKSSAIGGDCRSPHSNSTSPAAWPGAFPASGPASGDGAF